MSLTRRPLIFRSGCWRLMGAKCESHRFADGQRCEMESVRCKKTTAQLFGRTDAGKPPAILRGKVAHFGASKPPAKWFAAPAQPPVNHSTTIVKCKWPTVAWFHESKGKPAGRR